MRCRAHALRWATMLSGVGLVVGLAVGLGCNLTGLDTSEAGDYPECEAFLADYGEADGAACSAVLDCAVLEDEVACGDAPVVTGGDGLSVTCHWGKRFIGSYAGEMCSGEVDEVCVAAVLIGEGGPPCAGAFAELDEGVEVLDLACAEPVDPAYAPCSGTPYEDGVCACAM